LGKAQDYLDKAMLIQPTAPSLGILQVVLWIQAGKTREAIARASKLLKDGVVDPELLRIAYELGKNNKEPALAIEALELGIKAWPEQAVDGWMALGKIYSAPETKDEDKAVAAYSAALSETLAEHREALLAVIPRADRDRIE
jgi:predicted Zn-dependent protease